jgi:hypothetical protein
MDTDCKCLACGTTQELSSDQGFFLCSYCQEFLSGYLIMVCMDCGECVLIYKIPAISDAIKMQADEGRQVFNIFFDTTISLYQACPRCDQLRSRENFGGLDKNFGKC